MIVELEEMKLCSELIEALSAAADDAGAMVHQHHDLRWRVLADGIFLTKNGIASIAASMLTLPKTVIVDKVH